MPVTHITSDSQFHSILNNVNNNGGPGGDKLFLVDYSAKWCGPCKTIAPVFEKLSGQYGHSNFQFIHVDIDECEEASNDQKVKALPTFVFYKNTTSTELARLQGADPKSLEAKIKTISSKFEPSPFSTTSAGNKLGGSSVSSASTTPVIASAEASSSDLSADELVQIAQASVEYSLSSCVRVGIRFQPGITGGALGAGYKPFLRINGSEKISKLREFIDTLLEVSGVDRKTYELRNSYPPGKLDEGKTISEGGVAGAVVVVQFL